VPHIPPAFANGLWYLSCLREARAFRRALSDVAGTQERLLLATLKRNEDTEYGRRHGVARIRSAHEDRQRVQPTDYGDYAGAVDASQKAKTWSLWSFGIGLVFGVAYFGLIILGAAMDAGR